MGQLVDLNMGNTPKIKEIKKRQVEVDREKARLIHTRKAGLDHIVVPVDLYEYLVDEIELMLYYMYEEAVEKREVDRRMRQP